MKGKRVHPGCSIIPLDRAGAVPGLSGSAVKLMVRLGVYENGQGTSWPSNGRLMAEAGIAKWATFRRARQELAALGLRWTAGSGSRLTEYSWVSPTEGVSHKGRDQRKESPKSPQKESPIRGHREQLKKNRTNSVFSEHEQAAKRILSEYASRVKLPRLDSSRTRAKGHLVKLLKKHPEEDLLRAVRNYATDSAGTKAQYRRGAGNFFGRDADWEAYTSPGWKPDGTEERCSDNRKIY